MYSAPFEYAAPTTLEEALSLLEEHGEDARVLAGGQSLIPLMKLRFATPALLIDINRIPDLDYVEESADDLLIGPLARNNALADSAALKERYPTMAAAAPLISDPVVRNLGTLAGSLAHADPAGDWGSVMLSLGARVAVTGPSGEREIPVAELFQGPFTTALEPTEVITEVRVPKPSDRSGGTYLKLERKVGDFATVGAAVSLELDDGHVGRAGIGLTALGPQNLHAKTAEEALAGAEPGEEAFDEAARLAADAAEPVSDLRGSADYKRETARVFVRRGLAAAHETATAT
ncbi:MAG TPA: xanthine dehydrogenase family protein subunit M [Solirubrobacterales bacterium]|jgi:carbon-monoxide dehydrogenase medium subunit|nr:xanthine dehydrogenase family protein subunit M [Solirubrobacterales bacterium]